MRTSHLGEDPSPVLVETPDSAVYSGIFLRFSLRTCTCAELIGGTAWASGQERKADGHTQWRESSHPSS